MNEPKIVCWTPNSEFCRFVFDHTARTASLYRGKDDRFEPMGEVWNGLRPMFLEGQGLDEKGIGLLRTVITRRVHNYFRSQGVGWRKQPRGAPFDHLEVQDMKSSGNLPDQVIAELELLEIIEKNLSQLPPRWSTAIKSRCGYPDAPAWSELVARPGTTRQNESKLARKGLEQLKLRLY